MHAFREKSHLGPRCQRSRLPPRRPLSCARTRAHIITTSSVTARQRATTADPRRIPPRAGWAPTAPVRAPLVSQPRASAGTNDSNPAAYPCALRCIDLPSREPNVAVRDVRLDHLSACSPRCLHACHADCGPRQQAEAAGLTSPPSTPAPSHPFNELSMLAYPGFDSQCCNGQGCV